MTFEELRAEYVAVRIGPLILRAVEEAVGNLTKRYPPSVYAEIGTWDAASRENVVQGVIAGMLLAEGQLDYIFAQVTTIGDFRGLLYRQVKRFLARNRQTTVVDNLLDRAKQILAESPFLTIQGDPVLFRLEREEREMRPPTEDELRLAGRAAAPIPAIPFNVSERAPIVYSRDNLIAVLKIIALELPTTFSVRDLDTILRILLTDWIPGFLGEVEEEQVAPSSLSPEDEAQVEEATTTIMGEIEEGEKPILRGALMKRPDRELAEELGVSRQTVIARRQRLLGRLEPILAGLEEHIQVEALGRISVALSVGGRPGV